MLNILSGVIEFSKIERIAAHLKPVDYVTITYQILMMITIMFHFSAILYAGYFIVLHLVIIGFILWFTLADNNILAQIIRPWNPIIIIPLNFSELHYLVHAVNPVDWDEALIYFDYVMFGVHPTVWMERWLNPWLTEYLQLVYASFYFLPIILAIILYRKKDYQNFDFFIFVIVLGYYLFYLGYFLVPAVGPRFVIADQQTVPLKGIWLTEKIRYTLDFLENTQRDAFPSGHTEITLLTMFYSWKFSRTYFFVLLIVGTSMIFATVYLRYHYVIDIIAGVWLAVFILFIVRPLYDSIRSWQELKQSR